MTKKKAAAKKATKKLAKKATKKVAKKVTAKKATKKATAKKATKKVATKKVATKKATAKKTTAKTATKKVAAKKTTKKSVSKKVSAQKPAAAAPVEKASAAAESLPIPAVGAQAPTFTLEDQDGNLVSLENFRGSNVLVYFYPRAMTPGCTVQACALRDRTNDLAAQGIIVLGISPDQPAALKKFIARDNLNFTLLSDVDHSVATAYGAYGQKKFMGKTFDGVLRQSYLVGKDGQILNVIKKVDTATHADDVLKLFQELA